MHHKPVNPSTDPVKPKPKPKRDGLGAELDELSEDLGKLTKAIEASTKRARTSLRNRIAGVILLVAVINVAQNVMLSNCFLDPARSPSVQRACELSLGPHYATNRANTEKTLAEFRQLKDRVTKLERKLAWLEE